MDGLNGYDVSTEFHVGDVVQINSTRQQAYVAAVDGTKVWLRYTGGGAAGRYAIEDLRVLGPADPDDPRREGSFPTTDMPPGAVAEGVASTSAISVDHPEMIELIAGHPYYKAIFDNKVEEQVANLLTRRAALQIVEAAEHPPIPRPPIVRLNDFLQVPDEDVTHRIDGLWPTGGRVVLSAPYKAGKSTMVANVLRSLVDGQTFLGRFAAATVGRVLLLDNELDDRMLRRWLRDQGIAHADAVDIVCLRGRLTGFNILDPDVCAEWARYLGPADIMIFDCLRPALDALGLSEDKDAGKFLTALDELAAAAGISELMVVHHMGHTGERSRGDSRILDWPDATWLLVRKENDDTGAPRQVFFRALGRDVDHPESLLHYEPLTRHLTLVGGSRQDTTVDGLVSRVVEFVTENPGASKKAVETSLDARADTTRKAITKGIERGVLRLAKEGRSHALYVMSSMSSEVVPDADDMRSSTSSRRPMTTDDVDDRSRPPADNGHVVPGRQASFDLDDIATEEPPLGWDGEEA